MHRREFISDISFGLAAACTVCLGACSKSSGAGGGGPAPGGGGPVNITLDLNNEIRNVGDSTIKSGVIIVRLAATNDSASFTAVQAACTHEGSIIGFNTSQGIFKCPNHGSEFSTSGAVLLGPATRNLKQFNVSISGNILTVS